MNSAQATRSFGYLLIVLCSMFMNYIINILNTYVLYYTLMLVITIYFLFRSNLKMRMENSKDTAWWFVALLAVTISTLRTSFNINSYVGMFTFIFGFIVFLCSGSSSQNFDLSIRFIKLLSLYYAITVWIQILIPRAYTAFTRLIPTRSKEYIYTLESSNVGYTGFTTNPGFTAGYIIIGLLAFYSFRLYSSRASKKRGFLLEIFLLGTLLMTGKRGHLLAFIAAILVVYIITAPRVNGKMGRIAKIALPVTALVVILIIFNEMLCSIPVLGRLYQSIYGILSGEDITNNRFMLYRFGLELFKEHPFFGVGWLQYRQLSVGNITFLTTINMHNIYLQMLAEMGVVGFICMALFMISSIRNAIQNIILVKELNKNDKWYPLLLFSFGYQVFFLLYGISGNPLYDQNFFLMYLFTVCIGHAFKLNYKQVNII